MDPWELANEALGHLKRIRLAVKSEDGRGHLDAGMELVRQLAVGPGGELPGTSPYPEPVPTSWANPHPGMGLLLAGRP